MACVHVVPDLGYDAMNTSFGASGMARIAAIVLGEVTGRYVTVVSMAVGGMMKPKPRRPPPSPPPSPWASGLGRDKRNNAQ